MCTLAVWGRVFADAPVIVAANRDEFLARPSTPPAVLRSDPPRAFGGRDTQAGGTWLGVGETGLVVAMLNRRTTAPPDSACRSRGQLCVELLACGTATAAAALVERQPAGRYNPFNAVIADATATFVASQPPGDPPRLFPLERGLHLVTNLDVNDPTCPRIAGSRARFDAAAGPFGHDGNVPALVERLQAVLGDHATPMDPRDSESLCVHRGPYGTRSSSVIVVGGDGRPRHYFHAEGPPCRTPLAEVALPF